MTDLGESEDSRTVDDSSSDETDTSAEVSRPVDEPPSDVHDEVIDRSPDDCDHEKTMLTVDDGDGGYERVCILCNDVEQITLDE